MPAQEHSQKLGADKTRVAKTIEEAVEASDIIFTMVGTDSADKDMYETALKVDVKGKIFVDCATVEPNTTNGIAKSMEAKGASFLASPVFGPPAMADSGQLIFVLSGPEATIAKIRPYTKGVMGREVIEMKDQEPGKALLMKITGNTFILNMVESIAQGLTMGEATGLGIDYVRQFIEHMFPGPHVAYANRMIQGDYFKKAPLMAVDLAIKDASHALSISAEAGNKLAGIENAKRHLEAVKEYQGETGDMAGIYGAVRQESGLPFKNDGSK